MPYPGSMSVCMNAGINTMLHLQSTSFHFPSEQEGEGLWGGTAISWPSFLALISDDLDLGKRYIYMGKDVDRKGKEGIERDRDKDGGWQYLLCSRVLFPVPSWD